MTERTYPYSAWVLTPQFNPVKKNFVSAYKSFSQGDYGDNTDGGVLYSRASIFLSREAAIKWAKTDIDRQQSAIDKKQDNLEKRKANIAKADQEP